MPRRHSSYGRSPASEQHLALDRMRAAELGAPVARAAITGISALIDDRGRIVGRLRLFETGVLRGTLGLADGATPYARAGDWTLAFPPTLVAGWRLLTSPSLLLPPWRRSKTPARTTAIDSAHASVPMARVKQPAVRLCKAKRRHDHNPHEPGTLQRVFIHGLRRREAQELHWDPPRLRARARMRFLYGSRTWLGMPPRGAESKHPDGRTRPRCAVRKLAHGEYAGRILCVLYGCPKSTLQPLG